jgi:nucleotide-binding universal stress UspA family protein
VVVGVDGSTSANAAVNAAAAEAMAYGVPLRIVHAYAWPVLYAALANVPYRPQDWQPAEASESTVTAVADRVRRDHPDLAVQTQVTTGGAGAVLVEESRHATAVVIGARGAGGIAGLLTGSVVTHVAAHGHCPVIVVHDGRQMSGPDRRVVVGVDGTDSSLGALRYACDWARRHAAAVTAVYAVPRARFDRPMPEFGVRTPAELKLAEWIAPAGEEFPTVEVRPVTVHGQSSAGALTQASGSARLLVVGSRHRGELLSAMLGSVGATLIRESACPVVVVHGGPSAAGVDCVTSGGDDRSRA